MLDDFDYRLESDFESAPLLDDREIAHRLCVDDLPASLLTPVDKKQLESDLQEVKVVAQGVLRRAQQASQSEVDGFDIDALVELDMAIDIHAVAASEEIPSGLMNHDLSTRTPED